MKFKSLFLPFIYFLTFTLVITYPLVLNLGNLLIGLGDELLISWIMNWNVHSLINNPLNIFNANIFYPYSGTLSFSDAFFTSTLIGLLPYKAIGEASVFFNFNLIFSLTTLGFFTYILTRYLSKNEIISIISGTLVAFSPFTLGRITHLQVISIQWIPLSLLFFILYAETGRYKYLLLCSLFFVIQTANSFLPGYFLVLCYISLIVFYFLRARNLFKKFITKKVFIICIATFLIILPMGLPYINTSIKFNSVRDIRDSIHFANRPEYFFYPNDKTRLKNLLLNILYKDNKGPYFYDGYLGFTILILFVLGIIYRIFNKGKNFKKKIYIDAFLLIALSSFLLSLGPAFQWGGKVIKKPFFIPLPYALFYYLVPGFKAFRNSARWEMLTVFCLSILIGLLLTEITRKWSVVSKAITFFLICVVVFAEVNFPFTFFPVPKKNEFPQVYHFIKDLPKSAIIELPMYNWDMQPHSSKELMREYFSTLHFKKMVNGYSGFSPLEWEDQTRVFMLEFPSEKTINVLKKIRVKYIVLHRNEYKLMVADNYKIEGKGVVNWEFVERSLNNYPGVTLIKKLGEDYVYELVY